MTRASRFPSAMSAVSPRQPMAVRRAAKSSRVCMYAFYPARRIRLEFAPGSASMLRHNNFCAPIMSVSLPQAPVRANPRLGEVRYDIRGELSRRARELEAAGRDIVHLNIGNPGRFGFAAPEHLRRAVAEHVVDSE